MNVVRVLLVRRCEYVSVSHVNTAFVYKRLLVPVVLLK